MVRISVCDIIHRKSASHLATLCLLASSGLALMTGCGMGKIQTGGSFPIQGEALQGHVHGGQQPVTGATIQLYAASTVDYPLIADTTHPGKLINNPNFPDSFSTTAPGPRPLVNCTGAADANNIPTPPCAGTTTDASGSFTISSTYTCPDPDALVYITATGGNPGLVPAQGATINNGQLAMMAALGSCGALTSSTFINISEVTTIASAYALAPFARINAAGGISVGTSTANIPGLARAMATVNNMVDISTGLALTETPAYAKTDVPNLNTSTVPQARINTLADMLATCVNTAGIPSGSVDGDGSAGQCGSLFTAATPASATSPYPTAGTAPADTLQAALNIAQNPGNNAHALWQLVSGKDVPFTPLPSTSEPTDWTIALTFTGGGLGWNLSPDGTQPAFAITNFTMALDADSNILVSSSGKTSALDSQVIPFFPRLNNLGVPQTPTTTITTDTPPITTFGGFHSVPSTVSGIDNVTLGSPGFMAYAPPGNLWTPGFYESAPDLSMLDRVTPSEISAGGANGFALDAQGNIWTGLNANIYEFDLTGTPLQTVALGGLVLGGIRNPTLDATGSVLWGAYTLGSNATLVAVDTTQGTKVAGYTGVSSGSVVADNFGNVYQCNKAQTGVAVFNTSNTTGPIATYNLPLPCSNTTAMDGLGNFWTYGAYSVQVTDGTTVTNVAKSILQEMSSGGTVLSPAADAYTAASVSEPNPLTSPRTMSVDGSGNLWILNDSTLFGSQGLGGGVLVEYVGIAALVVPVPSLALQFGQVGVRP